MKASEFKTGKRISLKVLGAYCKKYSYCKSELTEIDGCVLKNENVLIFKIIKSFLNFSVQNIWDEQ